jgi:pyrroloquinoline quinone (PQQ) biosynthesis protein C
MKRFMGEAWVVFFDEKPLVELAAGAHAIDAVTERRPQKSPASQQCRALA